MKEIQILEFVCSVADEKPLSILEQLCIDVSNQHHRSAVEYGTSTQMHQQLEKVTEIAFLQFLVYFYIK